MNFLEELILRQQESAKKLAEAQKEMQSAQARLQSAAQEHSSLTHLIAVERSNLAQVTEKVRELFPAEQKIEEISTVVPENQTDAVRSLLARHPSGIAPSEMWKSLRTQIKYRAYFYSILKRLRDKDEVLVRRGKYQLKISPKVDPGKDQPEAIH